MNDIDEEIDEPIEPADISIGSDNSELDKLYDDFNERYPIEKLRSLTIEEYTNLKEISEDYFCTWVERRAQKLGSIQGATSLKFGIYKINELPKIQCIVDNVNNYAWPKRYGKDNEDHSHYKVVFEQVKQSLVEVAEAAQKDSIDFATIDKSPLAPMFKWKVAFLYSKQRLLPVYSPDALKFLAQEKGFTLNKKTKISEIVLFLLSLKGVTNIWEYSRSLWRLWDARSKDAYNDFPVERWLGLFNEPDVFTEISMEVLKKILELGGKATCRQLADKYGDTPEHYNGICIKLAGRIAKRLGLVLEKNSSGSETRWKILFDGQKVESESDIPGNFTWILKPNLKAALEQYVNLNEKIDRQYFVAKISNQNVFETAIKNNFWRMQQRYDHEKEKSAVTNNLNAVKQVKKGDVLLLGNGDRIFAYGIVKESPKGEITTLSLQKIIDENKHEYFADEGIVRFEDSEAYYERNYNGCNSDWSQFINVEKWQSYCPEHPINNYGVQDAAGIAVHSIFKVKSAWANQKIKELDNQFEKDKPEEVKMIEEMTKILNLKKNIILQGAPGTGKTYNTAALALSIINKLPPRGSETEKEYHKKVMDEYEKQLIKFDEEGNAASDGQIGFVTFHQSMDYEDFVEGFKPQKEDKGVFYDIEDGIFKKIRELAFDNYEDSLKSEDEVKLDMDTKTVFERFCAQIETELKEKDCVDLIPSSKLKIRKVFRRADGSAKSISISRTETSPNQTLTLEMILRDYPKFKNGEIKSYEDIKPKYDSNSTYHGNAPYYFELLKQMKFFEEKHNISSKVQKVDLKNYVLIIDEINRGNVSKIFGELISLLEADKRFGGDHPLSVTLPYSKDSFVVPSNLYIIGTMNTTDRSVGSIDYAVRRRFAFVTLEANESMVPEGDARNLFNAVKNFLNKSKYDMDIEDLMVGHSYFMDATNLQMKWQYEILPLLMEYHKDGIINQSPLNGFSEKQVKEVKVDYKLFIEKWPEKKSEETEK